MQYRARGLYHRNIDFSPRTIRITPRMDSEQRAGLHPPALFCCVICLTSLSLVRSHTSALRACVHCIAPALAPRIDPNYFAKFCVVTKTPPALFWCVKNPAQGAGSKAICASCSYRAIALTGQVSAWLCMLPDKKPRAGRRV